MKDFVASFSFDVIVFILGLIGAIIITIFALKKDRNNNERYYVALLAAVVFGTYALINYDPYKCKSECQSPSTPMLHPPPKSKAASELREEKREMP